MYSTAKLIDIVPEQPDTWKKKIFLTFDNDWAHDDIIKDTVDLVEQHNVHATFFVTDQIPQLDRIRSNSKFTLGIHPNFRPLLIGKGTNIHDEIDRCMNIVPEATSCRSHGVIQGGDISQALIQRGIKYESNESVPFQSGIRLKPYKLNGPLIRLPYFWADEHEWLYDRKTNMSQLLAEYDFCVFDFHPIHVFLNTESTERYESTRDLHKSPDKLIKERNTGIGTRTKLIELLNLAQ
jgi:hypothetical protein